MSGEEKSLRHPTKKDIIRYVGVSACSGEISLVGRKIVKKK